jgi:hypothetical protein
VEVGGPNADHSTWTATQADDGQVPVADCVSHEALRRADARGYFSDRKKWLLLAVNDIGHL